jgi:predicted phage terminase large subunit-like protein
MSDQEDLLKILKGKLALPEKYIPQRPTPHQAAFLLVPHKEVFFGGSAGPGKSSALLMAALQYVDQPNYKALILRKTFQDLSKEGALIPRSKEWLMNSDARWNETAKKWTFPSGAVLAFGHMDDENAKYNYQGSEWHFIGFDELTHFTETQYMYMHSRNRTTNDDPIPCRIRSTGNPGGIGHEWVKARFVQPPPLDEATFGMDEEMIEEYKEDRQSILFIPALLRDNPHLGADYERSLKKLDAVTRAQLLNGDWDMTGEGNLFKREWFDGRIIDCMPQGVDIIRRVRYWDLASTDEEKVKEKKGAPDYTASCLMGLGDNGQVYVLEMSQDRMSPLKVEDMIKKCAIRDVNSGGGLGSTIIWMEEEPGSSGKNTIQMYGRYVLMGYPFFGDKPSGGKIERARPASSACENGAINLVKGSWTNKFINELVAFPIGQHDDMVDAFTGAFSKIASNAMVGTDYRALKAQKKQRKSLWG